MLKLFFVSYIKYPIFPLMFPLWLVLCLFRFLYSYALMNKKVWGYICIQNSAPITGLGKDIGFFGATIYQPDPRNLLIFTVFVILRIQKEQWNQWIEEQGLSVSVAIIPVIRNGGFMSNRNIKRKYNFSHGFKGSQIMPSHASYKDSDWIFPFY